MAFVAGVLEALVLIPVQGYVSQLPHGVAVAELPVEGARLVPLTNEVRARFGVAAGARDKVAGFRELTHGIAHWAENLSDHWTVLYVHCEFWAGHGIHAAIAWSQGSVVFGPKFTRTPNEEAEPPYELADGPGMAIHAALRALGVRRAA